MRSLKKYVSNENIETGDPQLLINIPVCYEKEYGTDLDFIASQNNISVEEIIHLHSSAIYHVYMLGFLPGFAYMGLVDEKISSPRKQQPALLKQAVLELPEGKQEFIHLDHRVAGKL